MAREFQQAGNTAYRFLGPLIFDGKSNVHDRFKCSHRTHRDMICPDRWSLHFTFRLRHVSHAWVDISVRVD